jgi:hypothetical protein
MKTGIPVVIITLAHARGVNLQWVKESVLLLCMIVAAVVHTQKKA